MEKVINYLISLLSGESIIKECSEALAAMLIVFATMLIVVADAFKCWDTFAMLLMGIAMFLMLSAAIVLLIGSFK
jgi:hypothetical protein